MAPSFSLLQGDALERLREIPDNTYDSIITDPPYGLSREPDIAEVLTKWLAGEDYQHRGGGFMGRSWDSFVPGPALWREVLRVLKPGGHAVVFAGARTQDLMGISLRLAGFEIKDCLAWIYGSGFPKSRDVGKALDKLVGAEREVLGVKRYADGTPAHQSTHHAGYTRPFMADERWQGLTVTAPATDAARQWDGWGTALKPSHEPILLCRKPLDARNVASNVLEHGTGGLNVAGCRVGTEVITTSGPRGGNKFGRPGQDGYNKAEVLGTHVGRWPSNLLLGHAPECAATCASGCPVAAMDRQSGPAGSNSMRSGKASGSGFLAGIGENAHHDTRAAGGASRFFPCFEPDYDEPFLYCSKASTRERNAGLKALADQDPPQQYRMAAVEGNPRKPATCTASAVVKNPHPTVKPLKLIQWLCRLVTPPGGRIFDPFAGSGTTGCAAALEGFSCTLVEREAEYIPIIRARVAHWAAQVPEQLPLLEAA